MLTSLGELDRLRGDVLSRPRPACTIRVCTTGCRAAGAMDVCDALDRAVVDRGLTGRVRVARTGCHGLCAAGAAVVIEGPGLGGSAQAEPEEIFYGHVAACDAPEIVERTVLRGEVIERLCCTHGGQPVAHRREMPFYKHQHRLVLANCGRVDPTDLEDCLAAGAYSALPRVLSEMSPEEVIEAVAASGLRGRGGAGFPTGTKWRLARQTPGELKYVICNADEGDPGAFMDRALLEGDPHLILEGMLIGAYAIGARKGIVYVRAEYPIAIEHTQVALRQARELGLIGRNVLGTGLHFEVELFRGAGAFVCGEETALIASVEGKRGMPRPRPPFPTTSGLHGRPTCINNVETWANVPRVFQIGAEAYARIGTPGAKGTKIFALAGKVTNTGLVEVPMGVSLRRIVFDIGGGIPDGGHFKAAQMGGPSGGCVPEPYLDLPIDFDSLKEAGAIIGSGGLIVMDERTCMVEIARFFTEFVERESCGKCVPCRIGTQRMLEILTRMTTGQAARENIEQLQRLGELMQKTSLCGLGQTAANPVLSTLRHFRGEYEAHVLDRRCPAGVCRQLLRYRIDESRCTACGACRKVCPVDAISGEKGKPHAIDEEACIKCGACRKACAFQAVLLE